MKTRAMAAACALVVVAAGCAESGGVSTTAAPSATTMAMDMTDTTMAADMNMGDGEMGDFAFGDPMEASMADEVIEITAKDDFTFEPSSVTVTAGETITFRVTNSGAVPHDFVLGDSEMQDEHEAEMVEMGAGMAHDEPNVFSLEPGETKETTWHLTQSGELIFGCHQVGHYAAGMKGTVTIEG